MQNNFYKGRQQYIYILSVFSRYIQGKTKGNETQILENWGLGNMEDDHPEIDKKVTDKSCEDIYRTVANELNFKRTKIKINPDKDTDNYIGSYSPKNRIPAMYRYVAVASILILVVGGLFILEGRQDVKPTVLLSQSQPKKQIYQTGLGEIKQVELSDGSMIYLNAESHLFLIQDKFNKDVREIWLEEGEAFFEVAKNPEKPFIVHTKDLETIVRGTAFNVKAYSQIGENSVSVKNGKVEVRSLNKTLGILTANKRIISYPNDSTEMEETDGDNVDAWRYGRISLNNVNAEELKIRIKQHFGVELETNGLLPGHMKLNLSLSKEALLSNVLDRIRHLYNVHYKIDKNKVTLYQ